MNDHCSPKFWTSLIKDREVFTSRWNIGVRTKLPGRQTVSLGDVDIWSVYPIGTGYTTSKNFVMLRKTYSSIRFEKKPSILPKFRVFIKFEHFSFGLRFIHCQNNFFNFLTLSNRIGPSGDHCIKKKSKLCPNKGFVFRKKRHTQRQCRMCIVGCWTHISQQEKIRGIPKKFLVVSQNLFRSYSVHSFRVKKIVGTSFSYDLKIVNFRKRKETIL